MARTYEKGLYVEPSASGQAGVDIYDNLGYLRDGWAPLIEDTHWNDQPASTSTITMNSDLTAWLRPGMPVKFKLSGSYYYAILTAVASGLLTIAGAPLTTGDGDLEELYIGRPEKVTQMDFFVAGNIDDGDDATLLASDNNQYAEWNKNRAHLVKFRAHIVGDPTTSAAFLNVMLGGNAVSTSNSNEGIALTDNTQWYETGIDINTTNYVVDYDESIEVAVYENGGGTDDLSLSLIFVSE